MAIDTGVEPKMLASLFNCDERTIRTLAQKGIIVREGRGRYALGPSIKGYVTHLREQAAARAGQDASIDPVKENALLKRSQREGVDLKNALMKGSVVKVDQLSEGWTRVVRAVRAGILAAPGKIRFELPHISSFDEEVIDRVLRQALEDAALGDTPPPIDGVKADEDDQSEEMGPTEPGKSGEDDPDDHEPAG